MPIPAMDHVHTQVVAGVHHLLSEASLTTLAWTISLLIATCLFFGQWSVQWLSRTAHPPEAGKAVRASDKSGSSKADETTSTAVVNSDEGDVDAIIVGAGVAGSALAFALGKEGRRVLLLERDLSEPDRIVGELLQPGGYLKLVELGLEDCVEGIDAQLVWGYALFKDGKDTKVAYPLDSVKSGPAGSAQVAGRSFHNGRFVQKLREKAASLPNVRVVEATVTALIEEGDAVRGVKYRCKTKRQAVAAAEAAAEGAVTAMDGAATSVAGGEGDGAAEVVEAHANLTFVCDGCFSKFRRSLSRSKVDSPSNFVGLVLSNCQLPYPNYGHVVLAQPSPILFYPISSSEVRCLVDVPGPNVPSLASGAMAQHLKSFVMPQLPEQLRAPFLAAVESGQIRMMPNKIMPAAPVLRPGALLMGDAFNMRHPLTGGGMTVALSDIALLTSMLSSLPDFNDPHAIISYTEAFFTRRKPVAATINTLACALYKVFCASPDAAMAAMRQACFDYLSLGGIFSSGPVALLSGLNPQPLSLVMHFFAVAVYGVGRLLLPFPTPYNLWMGFRLLKGASDIIIPIILAEGVRKMFFPVIDPSYYKAPKGAHEKFKSA